MNVSIFDLVKEQVTPKAAVTRYGVEVNNGFCHCLFHEDKTPSMKLYKDHYHCYGCGAHGDTIRLISHILGLSQTEAAHKIVEDFGIQAAQEVQHNQAPREPLPPLPEEVQKSSEESDAARFVLRSWFVALVKANSILNSWKSKYNRGDVPLEASDARYLYAIKYQSDIEYRLDVLTEKKDDLEAAYETLRAWLKHTSAGKMQEYRLIANGFLDNEKEISILI